MRKLRFKVVMGLILSHKYHLAWGLKCEVPDNVFACSLWFISLYSSKSLRALAFPKEVICLVNTRSAEPTSETPKKPHLRHRGTTTCLILRKLAEVFVQRRDSPAFLLKSLIQEHWEQMLGIGLFFFFFSPCDGILRTRWGWDLLLRGIRAPSAVNEEDDRNPPELWTGVFSCLADKIEFHGK